MIDVIDTIFINQLFLTKTCSRSQEEELDQGRNSSRGKAWAIGVNLSSNPYHISFPVRDWE